VQPRLGGYTTGMIGDDWVLGWIVDWFGQKHGAGKAAGFIVLAILLGWAAFFAFG